MSTIRFIMKYIFLIYLFDMLDVNTLSMDMFKLQINQNTIYFNTEEKREGYQNDGLYIPL
jgi:hypothetical protein